MALVKWVDLSSVGVHLGSYRDANNGAGVAIIDMEGKHHEAIVGLGFQPANGALQKGLYLRPDHSITPGALRSAFGNDAVKFFADDRAAINRRFNDRVREITRVNSQALFLQQRPIGMNHLGEIVQESVAGRYILRKVGGKSVLLQEEGGGDPALFVRAKTREQLRRVAKGFVKRIVVRNEQLRREHVARLIDVSNHGEFSKRDYQEAIEIGINELFSEGLESIFTGPQIEPLAGFDLANSLYTGMPELKERTANSIANQQYSTPVPIAALMQAMLGRRAELVRASLLDPTIGNANLVSMINVGVDEADRTRVFGVEIDPARVEAAQEASTQALLGDAITANFRGIFSQPEGFDFIIANPPFGSLDSKVDVPLPEGSANATMTTMRQDHLILLRALHARTDLGRAVFVTGADSAIENGEVKGRSKHLLNYLYDHYHVEGVVDVSGELYKKQGATFPLRLYVVGARKAAPQEEAVPEKLEVIRTYEGLREWAAQVIAKQVEITLDIRDLTEDDAVDQSVEATQVAHNDVQPEEPTADISGNEVRAVVVTSAPLADVPEGWMVMNAPRPLLGQMTSEGGEFNHGRFYAAIDPSGGALSRSYFERNVRDDAYMVYEATEEGRAEMALQLVPERYRAAYQAMDSAERERTISTYVGRLSGMTFGELKQLAEQAVSAAPAAAVPESAVDQKQAFLAALIARGWENQGGDGALWWVTRTIGGGQRGMVNPEGDRRLSARLQDGRMLARWGDNPLLDLMYSDTMSADENAAALDAAVSAIDPRVTIAVDAEEPVAEPQGETDEGPAEQADGGVEEVQAAGTSYSVFDAGLLKMPTAVQLGLNKMNSLVLFENSIGWSNGSLLDVTGRPSFVTDAIAKYFVDETSDSIKHFTDASLQGVLRQAEGSNLKVVPVAMYEANFVQEGRISGSGLDMRREKPTKVNLNTVVLVNEEEREAVMVDRRYVAYFMKQHGDVEFFARVDAARDRHAVVVKSGDELVGLMMPIKGEEMLFERAMQVAKPVEPAARVEPPKVMLRDATMMESAASKKAEPMNDIHGGATGWRQLPHRNNDGVTLVSVDGLKVVEFVSSDMKSGAAALRAFALAQCFAMDNPYQPEIVEGPRGELVVQPLMQGGAKAVDNKPAARTRPKFTAPPTDQYQLEKSSLNAVKLRPLPGKSFTDKESEQLIAWFSENGWSAAAERNFVKAVGSSDARWTDVPKAVRVSKAAQKQAEKVEQAEAARAEATADRERDLQRLESTEWIEKVFGPEVMNDFNKAELARYLDGEVDNFDGLTNHNWSSGFAAVGIDDQQLATMSVQDALAAVKNAYVRERAPAAVEEKIDTRQDNDYQQRYIAYSNVSEPDTMIPANLSGPIYDALASIKATHGDIDEFVAGELRLEVADLGKYYKAEQVDAMAMIFHANNRGLGFLLGDKMGVGKGRVLAGVARRERLNGRIPVFITVTPNLFSDFLERDVAVTGSREMFKNPLIINDECKTVDEHGQVVVRALKRPEYKRYAEKGELPEGTDMILLTYSQISRLPQHSITSSFLQTLSAKYPLTFLLDESHNGAGASNTSFNLEQMIDGIGRRGSVVYSSGTAIKGAKNLRLYKKILPRGIDHEELLAVVESDPLSLQEALNWEIASQGCLISRELDNAGIEKQYVMSENVERNRAIADSVARIFSAMCYLSGDVAKVVGKMNSDIRKELENVPEADREGNRMGATSLNFGSRLHELNRQLLLAIKSPEIVQRAIVALESNVKPIISLQHTGESMLVDFLTRANEVYGEAEQSAAFSQKVSVIDNPVTFKDLLLKYLEKVSWIKMQGRYGDVSFKQVEGEKFEVAIERIKGMIDELTDDLPLTPIDYIREGLAAKGYTMAEISGRNLMARTLEDGRVSIEPVPGRTDKTRANRAVRDFNNGECDVLLLTGSGSTGLSVQASPSVGHDVRARRMIKAEMQPDIARERQMDGRHNRTGQIVLPEYEIPLCGLPADDRLAMMFNNKNRSLSSSTVANRDSKDLIKQVPDLLNEVGDMAAEDMLYEQPELARALDIVLPDQGESVRLSKSSLWYCNKLSGRLSLLAVQEQERVYADWQAKFVEKLDMLKAEGRNPLEVEVLRWDAQVVGREVFMGAVANSDGSKSNFNSPIYLTTLAYEKTLKAVRAAAIDKKIEGMNAGMLTLKDNTIATITNYLTKHRDELLEKNRSKKYETIEIALAAKEPNEVQGTAKKLEWMAANLPHLAAGAIFADKDLDGKTVPHVVIAYSTPSKIDGYARPSDYTLYTMQPGSDVLEMTTLSTLYSRGVELMATNFAKHDLVRGAFDKAENGVVTKRARVFDGNLFEATALNLREKVGRKIVYTDHTGARQHGILIHSDISAKKLDSLPEKVRDPETLIALLNANTPVTTDPGGDVAEPGFGMVISRTRLGTYSVAVPSSKLRGGDIFLDPVLSLIAGKERENKFSLNFSTNAGKMTASVKNHQICEFLSYLIQEKNLNFYLKDRAALRRVRSSLENVNEQHHGGGE